MLRADPFYKNNILSRRDELPIASFPIEDTEVIKQSNPPVLDANHTGSEENKHYIYYISDIHLDHKIYKRFGKHGNLQKIISYIDRLVDELLKDDGEKDIDFSMQATLIITGDVSHSLAINKIFYETLSERLPYHRDVFVVLGNHELWEYNSTDEALAAYNELFDNLPNIHLLHNSLYADNAYKDPNELNELYRQRWQIIKDKTITEKTKRKALETNGDEIDIIKSRLGSTEEERHKGRIKANIINQSMLQNMTANEIRSKCFDSKIIIFGAIGYSQYNTTFNISSGIYRDAIKTKEQEKRLSRETEAIYQKLAKSLPNNHLLIATHMPLEDWSKLQFQKGWTYFSGHTHKNQKAITDDSTSFADNQVGYYGKRIKFNLAITEGRLDYFAYYQDGIYDVSEADYHRFYWGISRVMTGVDRRGNGKIRMLKNSGMYMFLLETENQKLYLLEGGKRHSLGIQNVGYYYDHLMSLKKVVSDAISGIKTYLGQLSSLIKHIGGDGRIHGNIVDIDCFNHIMVNIRDGSMLPYFANSIDDRYEYPDLPQLLRDRREDLYKNLLEYGNNLPVANTNNQMSTVVNYSADTTIYRDSNIMLKIQDMLDYNVIRFWNDDLVENFENNNQLDMGGKLLN